MEINVNMNAVVSYANALERMAKSALPNAVRQTLTDAAKDVKTNTMPGIARSVFTQRAPNFFKANSRYEGATGSNINQMKSTVGFYENKLAGGSNNYAVKDLEQQEEAGTIGGKSFIPLPTARKGNSKNGMVLAKNRLTKINKIINARNSRGKNKKEKFIKAAVAAGKGGYVIGGNNKILYRVDSFFTNIKTRRVQLKVTPLYAFRRGYKVKVKAHHFMHKAAELSGKKMNSFFIKNAEKAMATVRI